MFDRFKTLFPYFRQHRYRIAAGLASLIICDVFQLLIPRVVKYAVDHLSSGTATLNSLAMAGLAIVGMAALVGLFRYIWRLLIIGFSRILEKDLRRLLYDKILILSPAWYLSRTTGDIMAHATNDLEAVRMAAGIGQVAVVDAVVMGTASIGFMLWIDPGLTALALIPMPLIPFLTRYFAGQLHRRHREVQETFGVLTGEIREYLSGVRVVQAHVREAMVLEDMDRMGRDYVKKNVRLNWYTGTFNPLMLTFTNMSLALLIYFGGRKTIFGTVSPGDFVAFISYLGLLTWPLMAMGWVTNLVQRGAASMDRINNILDAPPDIADPSHPVEVHDVKGRLEVRGLTFTYPEREQAALIDVNLDCPAGSITALVGRTGSGKSTILNLIPRLLDPPPGTVFLDGTDIRDLRIEDLRGAIGYVPQDGYIFSGTIAENIAFGRPAAGEAEIRAAAEAAGLAQDIQSFTDGYQSYIGERGVTLSGGQKQRLALARAFLLDHPLLLLDDTLSAVDAETEETILDNLCRIRKGRTTIIVSHRLTSLKAAELIHVIENGHVSQSGVHDDLLDRGGYYAQLYHLQMVQADYDRENGRPEAV